MPSPKTVAQAIEQLTDRCPGKSRRSGNPCKQKAGYGTDHPGVGYCKYHLGNSASHRRGAQTILAAKQIVAWGGRLDVRPTEALLDLVQAKAAEVAYWEFKVGSLSEEDRAGMLLADQAEADTSGTTKGEWTETNTKSSHYKSDAHVFLQLLHKAQDQLAQYCAAAVRVGVDEAMVRIAATQATAVLEFARRAIEVARDRTEATPDEILAMLVDAETRSVGRGVA